MMTDNRSPKYNALQAVLHAAVTIERAVVDLIEQTADLHEVPRDEVLELLFARLIVPKSQVIDWIADQPDNAGLQVAKALAAWRERWATEHARKL